MNILISLESRVLSEALYHSLKMEEPGDRLFISHEGHDVVNCRPDLVLTDHYNLKQKLLTRGRETKILLLDTGLEQDDVIRMILTYKLDGVLSTVADISLLKKAMKVVASGQIWIDNHNLKALLYKVGTISQSGKVDKISNREQQILDLLKKGSRNKEIAAQLFLSEQTIKSHLSRIYRKFNVSSRSQLISGLMQHQ